jgi:DMSO/TMAO reductase YedYZ molybdopterin-dependent catalytic subunit
MTATVSRPAAASQPDTAGLVPLKPSPFNAESAPSELDADVTPTSSFYVRSNFAVPSLDPAAYRLRIEGAVEKSFELSLDEIKALGAKTIATVMECAGNNRLQMSPLPSGEPWHIGAVSAGTWTGVPVRAVLERAGVRADAVEILFQGADHGKPKDFPDDVPFARSLPLDKALHDETLLVFAMNGGPLPRDHGAPIRLIVPSWYGMASVKWLQRIEAITEPFTGYYQRNRYIYELSDGTQAKPVTTMKVKSLITSPLDGDVVPSTPLKVHGKAWSGLAEVVKVEVAVDGGSDWREARLLPASGPTTWRAFEYEWTPDAAGRRALRSRATDAAGNVQPDAPPWNKYGYGNNAVRPIIFTVKA